MDTMLPIKRILARYDGIKPPPRPSEGRVIFTLLIAPGAARLSRTPLLFDIVPFGSAAALFLVALERIELPS